HHPEGRGVAAFVGHAGQPQDVLAVLFLDDVDDVVDGDLAHQPPAGVDHRGRNQVVLLEDVGDLFLVQLGADLGHRLHQVDEAHLAAGPQQAADRDGAHRPEVRIDDVDVE